MNLLLTEKPNCPRELQKNCDEIVFEQFEFAAYYRCVGTCVWQESIENKADYSRPYYGCV